ncbi:MAG: hypothetical protein GX270_02730 [Clostridiaceae bacterium]|nr:hypothetical protein [Clostridiaceae bacterium]
MINIDRWFLDFSKNSVNIDNIEGLNRFMKFLEEHQYQVGEKTSFYEFSEEPQSKEFRANLYYGYLKNIKFELGADKQPKEDEPFVTILIGSNGTGKTRALSIIESIFQDLNTLKTKKRDLVNLSTTLNIK